jgi:hypothetical protein
MSSNGGHALTRPFAITIHFWAIMSRATRVSGSMVRSARATHSAAISLSVAERWSPCMSSPAKTQRSRPRGAGGSAVPSGRPLPATSREHCADGKNETVQYCSLQRCYLAPISQTGALRGARLGQAPRPSSALAPTQLPRFCSSTGSAILFTHSSRLKKGPEERFPSSSIAYQPGLIPRISDLSSLM